MRNYILSLGVALMAATFGSAHASDADFRLKNKTGYQIDEVYVGRHASGSWGQEIMGSNALANGEWVNISFPNPGACHFDIKVKYHGDETLAGWNNVNLCDWTKITLFWDGKNQMTRAVGE